MAACFSCGHDPQVRGEFAWQAHVFEAHVVRTPDGQLWRIRPDVLLMLAVMASRMNRQRIYSKGHKLLIRATGFSQAKVTDLISEALFVGLLRQTGRGVRGRSHATYEGQYVQIVTGKETRRARKVRASRRRGGSGLVEHLTAGVPDQHGEHLTNITTCHGGSDPLNSDDPPPF